METKEYRLKQVTEKITKGTTPSNIGESFTEEGIMYFRSELIGKSKYIDKSDGLLFISNETPFTALNILPVPLLPFPPFFNEKRFISL